MGLDRLAEFAKANAQAQADGTAFDQADMIERAEGGASGAPPPAAAGREVGEPTAEEVALKMPQFFAQVDEVTRAIERIEYLWVELEKLHKRALAATSPEETRETSNLVYATTARLNQYSNKVRMTLRIIDETNSELEGSAPPGSGHYRMRVIKPRQLSASFLRTMKKVSAMQNAYRQKYSDQLVRQYKIVNPHATKAELGAVASNAEGALSDRIFASAVKDDAKAALAQMKERHEDVCVIERNIMELHQLFLDLRLIVAEQSDLINRVEFNVAHTAEYVDFAASDLKTSIALEKSIMAKKYILVAICGVVCFVLLIIFLIFLRPILMFIGPSHVPMYAPPPMPMR